MCAAAAGVVQKNYTYYDNDLYELESQAIGGALPVPVPRHITGPAPEAYLWNLVNAGIPLGAPGRINLGLGWEANIRARLTAANFNTVNILAGVPQETGTTCKGFVKSFRTPATAYTIVATAIVAMLPAIAAKTGFANAADLNWPALESSSCRAYVRYSGERWYDMVRRSIFSAGMSSSKLANSAVIAVKAAALAGACAKAYALLTSGCGPAALKAWQDRLKVDGVFHQCISILIPPAYHADPVIAANDCAIAFTPLRVPVRIQVPGAAGNVYEEVVIRVYYNMQMDLYRQQLDNIAAGIPVPPDTLAAQLLVPPHPMAGTLGVRCPFRTGWFSETDIQLDAVLSDTIELRLLLLEALNH